MKPNPKLIKQLQDGEIAVENNGTLEQLEIVLGLAAPQDPDIPSGVGETYCVQNKLWVGGHFDKPLIKLTDFFIQEEEFKWGEEVEVSYNENEWNRRCFVGTNPNANSYLSSKFIVVDGLGHEASWKYCRRPIKTITVTHEEALQIIAEKKGLKPEQITIQ